MPQGTIWGWHCFVEGVQGMASPERFCASRKAREMDGYQLWLVVCAPCRQTQPCREQNQDKFDRVRCGPMTRSLSVEIRVARDNTWPADPVLDRPCQEIKKEVEPQHGMTTAAAAAAAAADRGRRRQCNVTGVSLVLGLASIREESSLYWRGA